MNKTNARLALWGGLALTIASFVAFAPEAHAHGDGACHAKEGKRGSHEGKGFKKMDPAQFIQRFDKNGDGILEVKELPEMLQKRLAEADTNRDGRLSVEELQAHRAASKGKHGKGFAHLDKNGDGVLTRDEVGEKKWERISKADANKDGKVTKEELEQARAKRRAAKGKGKAKKAS